MEPDGRRGGRLSAWSRSQPPAVAARAAGASSAPSTGKTVDVSLTDKGCDPATATIPAGTVTFNVKNAGTAKVTEFELKNKDGIIIGERENVVEGIPGSFSLTVQPGTYEMACPNGDGQESGTLTVTGTASGASAAVPAAVLQKATDGYHAYVVAQSARLLAATRTFVAALDAGDLRAARRQFGPTRVFYERIEPVAESFGTLDPEIDARVNDVPTIASWTGFHRIEKILWVENTTDGTKPYATKLLRDVTRLNTRVQTLGFQPAQLANGAVELLNEVAGSKITGEEDRYSHTDLADFAANVAGAKAAFELLRPALIARRDGALVQTLNARFAAVERGLAPYRRTTPLGFAMLRRPDRQGSEVARPGDRCPRRAALDRRREDPELTVSRRRLLEATGGGALGLLLAGGGYAAGRETADASPGGTTARVVPFYGTHQAGIATPAQDRLAFAAFDLTLTTKDELRDLLRTWSEAAAKLTTGSALGPAHEPPELPPADTGEAEGLPAADLTITIGLGPEVFAQEGQDRLGLATRRPRPLSALGALPGELLDPTRSNGDLCVQACAADPVVAFHALRTLARIGRGAVVLRWTQLGFGRTSSTRTDQVTERNLMGFKDGTNNLKGDDVDLMRRHVWVGSDEPQRWMRNGSYLVSRRIRMRIESWDRDTLADQERVIGRSKQSGAPLTGTHEFDAADLSATNADGEPVIGADAHIRLATASQNNGIRLLRRGYSFADGIDPATSELDAGLFFLAFQRDPHRQFAALQRKLGSEDSLNEYIVHTTSGLFAIPPGARTPGDYVGSGLFV